MKTLTKLNILLLVCCLATSNIKAQKQAFVSQHETDTLKSEEVQTIRFALNNYLMYDKAKANKPKEVSAAIAEKMKPYDPDAGENTKVSFEFTKFHYQAMEGISGERDPGYPQYIYDLTSITLPEELALMEKLKGKKGEDYSLVLQKLVENCENAGNTTMLEWYKKELGD